MTYAVVIAAMLSLWALHGFGMFQMPCLRCGGKGAHRDDCPLKEDDD